jgi:putative spermidine/putrescine transport system substrate-binding protein
MRGYFHLLNQCLSIAIVAGAALPAPATAQTGTQPFAGQTLRVGAWGGGTGKVLRDATTPGFEQLTGAHAAWTDGDPVQFIAQLLAARGGAAPYDVIGLESLLEPQGVSQGLFVQPDESKLSNGHLLARGMVHPGGYGPAWGYFSLGIAYRPDKLKAAGIPAPKNLSILFDPRLAGHVAIPDVSQPNWPHFMPALAAYFGTPLSDPAPVLNKLAAIKQASLYTSSSDLEARMTSGEIWVSLWVDGRVNAMKTKGVDIELGPLGIPNPKGGTYAYYAGLLLFDLTNPARKALGDVFLNELLSTPVETKIALATGYTPTNVEALKVVRKDPKLGKFFNSDLSSDFIANPAAWQKVQNQWIDAWGKAMRR